MPKRVPKRQVARHRIPKASEAVEGRFRNLMEEAPDAMVVVDQTGTIVFVNSKTERLFGYQRDEMLGRDVEVIVPVRLREQHRHDRMYFLGNPHIRPLPLTMQLFALRKDGTEFPVEISLSPVETAEGFLVTSAIRDVTERKAAEEAQLRLAAVVESSEDAITSATLDGVIVSWNAGAQRMFGYTDAEAVGKPVTMLVPPELLNEENKILETVKAGGHIKQFETVRVTKTGERVKVSLGLSPIRDSSGEIVGCSGIARDITERKRAEEALRESEERLRLAVQAGRMFAYSWDAVTDVIERSGESTEILGVKSDQAATGAAISAMVHPDDKRRLEVAMVDLTVENPTLQITYRIIRPDGAVIWLERNSRAYFDVQGKLKRIVGMIVDITERKRAEEARFRHAAVVESFADAIISKNLDAVITSWNTGAERMFGYTEAEVIGEPITVIIPPELRDEENKILERLRAGGRIEHYETSRATKAGKTIAVSLTISPIKDSIGNVVGFSKIAHDITERKRAEQVLHEKNRALATQTAALRSQEELLKIFVKNVPAGVAMLDREMRYLQVSERWCADYGVDASQVLGRSHYEIFPDIPERWKEMHRRALDGETLRAEEDRWDRQAGFATWVRWEIRPWKAPDESIGGILILAEDITRSKHVEHALSGIPRKLIESQEQERTRIARELHDDINQRLALLAMEVAQLRENPSEVENRGKELEDRIGEISHDVEGLAHDLHSSKLDYLGAAAGIKGWCREFAERQKMEIDFRSNVVSMLPQEVGLSLLRVLQEALHNAIKYSGVRNIHVELQEQTSEVHLIVSDLGRGFDLETALQGKGLGLTSMRERVRLVNGTISIESKPMGGTTIHVCVPLESEHGSQRATG